MDTAQHKRDTLNDASQGAGPITRPPDQLETRSNGLATKLKPELSPYLSYAQVGSHWHRSESLRNLVIFGDSYSVSARKSMFEDDESTSDEEEGSDSDDKRGEGTPPIATWTYYLPNALESLPKIENFARPGETVEEDLLPQVSRYMSSLPLENKPGPGQTTYIIFMGINDVGGASSDYLEAFISGQLLDGLHKLYTQARARNFILIDVPPTDRSPAASSFFQEIIKGRVEEWNQKLRAHIIDFCAPLVNSADQEADTTPSITMLLFSFHKLLTSILDEPEKYDFLKKDIKKQNGGIWSDQLHLTPAVHRIVAHRLAEALDFGTKSRDADIVNK
ncbi:carbohydrate esterase family 16 protein [Macrolepiota fuliginosa MF-IS2]|uniref:Carbohydrate esterase family 16 protein n=1 Tax=Macrolepiota fuliginosa MF-IS2 TaxID=1400762 RepID=A0A9P5X2Y1_9AGAR|nr:carbohydrate esterase family 16 protein [Macrolepiota fuliginosa MF-IS2]